MELENNEIENPKTDKQGVFIFKLLQSKVWSKKEFSSIHKYFIPKLKTTKDASILIEMLNTTITAKKRFLANRCRAHIKCVYCLDKENVKRYYSELHKREIDICKMCDLEYKGDGFVVAEDRLERSVKVDKIRKQKARILKKQKEIFPEEMKGPSLEDVQLKKKGKIDLPELTKEQINLIDEAIDEERYEQKEALL